MISMEVAAPKKLLEKLGSQAKGVMEQVVNDLGIFAMAKINEVAQRALTGSYPEYARGLQDAGSYVVGGGVVTITLVGDMANALEGGYDGFDIKTAMLAKAKKRTKGGLPMVDIPFRHKTAGAGAMSKPAMRAMNTAVQKAQTAFGKSSDHMRIRSAFQGGAALGKTISLKGKKITVQHKADTEADMFRTPKRSGKGYGGAYLTIRRITPNSPMSSWLHPGFKGIRAFELISPEIKKLASKVLQDRLKQVGF